MGRKTFESVGRPLPHRKNLVVSSLYDSEFEEVEIYSSFNDAYERGMGFAKQNSVNNCFVVGGSQIYRHAFDLIDRIFLTVIDAEIEGDSYFPIEKVLGGTEWEIVSQKEHYANDQDEYDHSFLILDRVTTV